MLYDRSPIYAITHILIGFIAVWYPIIGIGGLIYQVGQLVLNIRAFPFEGKIRKGNNIYHTGLKVAEMGLGYAIGTLLHNRLKVSSN